MAESIPQSSIEFFAVLFLLGTFGGLSFLLFLAVGIVSDVFRFGRTTLARLRHPRIGSAPVPARDESDPRHVAL